MRSRPSRRDLTAGVVLGVQSVPDGLATGLLAGLNPSAGLYGYMVGTATGALVTSSTFMAVQGTGAMAMVIADVPGLNGAGAPRALATLSVLTGAVMLVAGLLRLGAVLRFVSNAVMVGFINAVGVNIVLGQLANLTGYSADGPNRVVRAVNTLVRPDRMNAPTLAVGLATIAIIILLGRTRLGAIGLVIAVIATSAAAYIGGWEQVATLGDLGIELDSLPSFEVPQLRSVPMLIIPAVSLAFVGLVQGAGISATFPNPDGTYPDGSRDFVGQGAANLASGVLQGMPVGGSVSASAINKEAGAQTRASLLTAAVVMAVVVVAFGDAVANIAMPALAGLLMLIGIRTIKPADLTTVWKVGTVQKVVLTVTFGLTMLVPLQYAVLIGVGLSIVLHVVRQSNQVIVRQQVLEADGHLVEADPPAVLPPGAVVILQPYGSLFFAAAPVIEAMLPAVGPQSSGSVVILRLRGRTDLGTTFMDMLHRYATTLVAAGSKLKLASVSDRVLEQLRIAGITDVIDTDDLYAGTERVGATLTRAHDDALAWVDARR
ncbi:MAG: SulP family inorganic anion transporter [Acidimicrobiales bacterium]|nr:SulP family inorganic anion transporter [Acidimicrobiales bacterium]